MKKYHKIGLLITTSISMMFISVVAYGQTVTTPPIPSESLPELLQMLMEAMKGGHWLMVAAVAIMILLSGMARLWGVWSNIDAIKPYLPWIAVIGAALLGFSAAIVGGGSVIAALSSGMSALVLGLSAIGFKEIVKAAKKVWVWFLNKIGKGQEAKKEYELKKELKGVVVNGSISLARMKEFNIQVVD